MSEHVYFIRVGRYFKIGASTNPQRRCERLHKSATRYTFPADVQPSDERTLYKTVPGWVELESAIHIALDQFSVGLEWFLDEPELREWIDALPQDAEARRHDLTPVERPGGWCEAEYHAVQHGRAEREVARYLARRELAPTP